MRKLSKQQQDDYERDGFILIENAVPVEVLGQMQSVTRKLIAESSSVTQHNEIYDLDKGHSELYPAVKPY